jgi:hypothetical protein
VNFTMRKAKVSIATHLSSMPNEGPGGRAVIKVITDLPSGEVNAFYIDLKDLDKNPIELSIGTCDPMHPDPSKLTYEDDIVFDMQDGLHKAVLWNGRKIRQRGYSFDNNAPIH